MVPRSRSPFPTVDVPDHAHYTIGSVILAIGITGLVGNFLVIYAFCRYSNVIINGFSSTTFWGQRSCEPCVCGRSRSLRSPANMFVINLAVADLLMCITQTPTFFITSLHKRWIFGERGNV